MPEKKETASKTERTQTSARRTAGARPAEGHGQDEHEGCEREGRLQIEVVQRGVGQQGEHEQASHHSGDIRENVQDEGQDQELQRVFCETKTRIFTVRIGTRTAAKDTTKPCTTTRK